MDFQFLLPVKNSDLLNSSGMSYYVKRVYSPAEIGDKLKECKQALLGSGDAFYIFDHFDTYFSLIETTATDRSALTNLMRSFDLLYITADKMGNLLTPILATNDNISQNERNSYLNLVKMVIYLFVATVKKIDAKIHQILQEQQTNVQKKRGKQGETVEQYPHWDGNRVKFLTQLYNIFELPLEKLWSPPVAEENFVSLICDICYRTLEIAHSRHDENLTSIIFSIFGIAIKRYNHALTFPVRILQILRTSESATVAIATGINILHEFGITSIFSVLIKDIVETLTLEGADTAVSKNFSNFLMELAGIAPKLMIPHLSTLGDELLNCDSYMLRNTILQIMGDAIVGELTSEDLSEELKEARNEFLENLLNHINDVSAHVRSKVLQIWQIMREDNAVPLSFQLKVLCEAVERLEDKTSSVRKYAVQLIKVFLEHNPFAPKLTLEELVKKYDEEVIKMEKLSDELAEERKKVDAMEEEWIQLVPTLLPMIQECIKQDKEMQTPIHTDENYEDLVNRISQMLLEKNFQEAITLVRKADYVAGNHELRVNLSNDDQEAYYITLLKSYLLLANGCKNTNEVLGTQINTVTFLQDSIKFAKVVTRAMPKIQELLISKINSDVFEAVDLFTTGYMFGIKGTETGMQQILYLVWSTDKEKRDAVSNAYKRILFTTDLTDRGHAIKVVQNLSLFLTQVEYGHYTALEFLMKEWVGSDDIDALIVQVLFERFTLKQNVTEDESRLALQLLIMASSARSSIASTNFNIIETIALSDRSKNDPRLFSSCLEFLLNSIDTELSGKFYKRHEIDSSLVQNVVKFFIGFFFHPRVPDFDNLAVNTLEFIYHLCQQPDIISQNIIFDLLKRFQEIAETIEVTLTQQDAQLETPYSQQVPGSQATLINQPQQSRLPVFLLTRFMFIIGYMIIKEIIFLDIDLYSNLKYRQELSECEQQKKQKTSAQNALRRKNALNMSATESLKRLSGTPAEPQQEPDEDLVGAVAIDNIAEIINHIVEEVLLKDDNSLFAKLLPIVIEICKYPGRYRDQTLQQAATLTLIRLMATSSLICEQYMPFLMNILNQTKNIKIKCNIVIGLSDLTFRFPNVVEPWSGHFYSTLHDDNVELRMTGVKMLSHLMLHEMIRVKAQIAEVAMCIVDKNNEIQNLTKQFFKDISNQKNSLYNVLPDIISKLSDTTLNLEEEKYRTIMRYVLGLIQKDRHIETLVEKLCLRFPVTREERQWRDIAFCLSLLSYNERALKKLIDNVNTFKDKVQIDEIYQFFKLIITNTSKAGKPELKTVVTEFETRLNECLQVNDGQTPKEGTAATNEPKDKTAKKAKQSKPASRRRGKQESTEESSSASEEERRPSRNKAQQKKGNKKTVNESNSSESSSSSENEKDRRPTQKGKAASKKAPPARSARQAVVIDSESSEDDEDVRPQRKRGRNNRKE